MIWLNPDRVMLGAIELRDVFMIAVDRAARRLAEEWTDLGPHAGFADVPEQRVMVSLARRILESEAASPKPGEAHTLTFRAGASASAAGVWAYSIPVVVVSVEHSMAASGGAMQRLRAVAVSPDGLADPVTESAAEGEA